jgi:hypothetical protein
MDQNEAQMEERLEKAREVVMPAIQAAKEKAGGGELLLIDTDIIGAEVLAFRIPTSAEWKSYRQLSSNPDGTSKVDAINHLVTVCCVYPERDNFKRIVDAHPGIIESCYGDLQEHAGAGRAKKARKL